MKSKGVVIGVVVLLVLFILAIVYISISKGEVSVGPGGDLPGQNGGQEPSTGEIDNGSGISGTQPTGEPSATGFVIDADDDGFYINGADIDSISASLGSQISIIFNVKTTNVYYGGLQFKGCGIDSGRISPGDSTTQEFTVENACTITSYWPSSSVVKDRLQVAVN